MKELEKLDKKIREGLVLLKEVEKSKALTREEREEVARIYTDFTHRLENAKLYLGIIGEFNSGKSTLLNAILNKKIAATSDKPCTPIPIYIEGGKNERILVTYKNGKEEEVPLSDYEKYSTYTEDSSDIIKLFVTVDAPFLTENNVILIDTPGINSMIPEHTNVTQSVVPQMHAAILLVNSKQPGAKSTVDFLKQVSQYIYKIFICVSKADYLNEDQLNRVVEELPRRLSKASGINIEKVWAVYITDKEKGKDFYDFLNTLHVFMQKEAHLILSKDLFKVLSEYMQKVSNIVENKVLIQEKLFYEYVEKTPVDFSVIFQKLQSGFKEIMEEEMNSEHYENLLDSKIKKWKNDISQIVIDYFKSSKKGFLEYLGFEKRVTAESLKGAEKVVKKLLSAFCEEVRTETEFIITKTVDRFKKYTEQTLSSINTAFKDFKEKLIALMMKDPVIKKKLITKRFVKTLWLPILLTVIFHIVFRGTQSSIPLYFDCIPASIGVLLAFLISFFLFPRDVRKFVYKVEEFSFPSFTIGGVEKISLFNTLSGKTVKSEHDIWRGVRYAPMAFRTGGVDALGITLIIGTVSAAINWFKLPKVSEVIEDILSEINKWLFKARNSFIEKFNETRVAINDVTDMYIKNIQEKYAIGLDEAFKINKVLLRKKKEMIDELERLLNSLKELQAGENL